MTPEKSPANSDVENRPQSGDRLDSGLARPEVTTLLGGIAALAVVEKMPDMRPGALTYKERAQEASQVRADAAAAEVIEKIPPGKLQDELVLAARKSWLVSPIGKQSGKTRR